MMVSVLRSVQSIEATVQLEHEALPFRLTGLKATHLADGDFGKVMVYVAGLGGSFQWAMPFWQSLVEDGVIDSVIGIDLRSFGVNHALKAGKLSTSIQDLTVLCQVKTLKKAFHIHHAEACFFSAISLGAMSSLYVLPQTQDDYKGIALLVPAFQGCKQTYTLPYVASALWQTFTKTKDAYLTLPYTMDAITQCPEARRHYKEHHADGVIQHPLALMTSILPWQLKASQQLKSLKKPVLMVTAGQDFICETPAMHKAFKQLPHHPHHQLAHFPTLYHDVLLEPDRHLLKTPFKVWLDECLYRLND